MLTCSTWQVLSEVKNPNRSLRIAIPTAMASITILYILTNIAYVWPTCPRSKLAFRQEIKHANEN